MPAALIAASVVAVLSAGSIVRFWRRKKWRELSRRDRARVVASHAV